MIYGIHHNNSNHRSSRNLYRCAELLEVEVDHASCIKGSLGHQSRRAKAALFQVKEQEVIRVHFQVASKQNPLLLQVRGAERPRKIGSRPGFGAQEGQDKALDQENVLLLLEVDHHMQRNVQKAMEAATAATAGSKVHSACRQTPRGKGATIPMLHKVREDIVADSSVVGRAVGVLVCRADLACDNGMCHPGWEIQYGVCMVHAVSVAGRTHTTALGQLRVCFLIAIREMDPSSRDSLHILVSCDRPCCMP